MSKKLFTVVEVAKTLNVSQDTIRRWEKKGLIKGKRDELNYRVFDISEIERVKNKVNGGHGGNHYRILKSQTRNGYSVVDLFSGAGGTALGLHNAGFHHAKLVENDKFAAQTLRQNKMEGEIIEDDIANLEFKKGEADVVEGGFPCQAFSYAGKKRGFDDTRGTLFFEFARAINAIKPKVAVGENVRGLLNHDGGRTLKTMITTLEELGYKTGFRILKSQYHDVPQKRERLIILGVRKDLDLPILFPREKDYFISLREALKGVPDSPGQRYPENKASIMKLIPPGGYWKDLPESLQKEYMGASYFHTGGKTGMARRLSWEEPSLTLTTSPAQKQTERCHPEHTRPLTVREYARIQTFPDNWEFAGSMNQQYKQIGNAVPVNLGFHIGQAVEAILKQNVDHDKFVFYEQSKIDSSINPQLALLA